jgi:hypothetical protein
MQSRNFVVASERDQNHCVIDLVSYRDADAIKVFAFTLASVHYQKNEVDSLHEII